MALAALESSILPSHHRHVDSSADSMVTVPLSPTDQSYLSADDDSDTTTAPLSKFSRGDQSLDAALAPADNDCFPRKRRPTTIITKAMSRRSTIESLDTDEKVDWDTLDKKEGEVEQNGGADESTALLLERLEQANQAIATDPKSGLKPRARSQSRPPSISQIKKMVENQNAQQVRYSLLPSPPPMTELDFWAALVRDYHGTAQRLPTLTTNKIRSGIPAPLRGVTWVSMAGARDRQLEEQYERLCKESSPYENMIGKDIGRSFPGVEMFRDAEGEGQKMLARVLKCFSLYDEKIGYCQGLGFLVGPLLMQMGDKEAFCVLVRLMDDYDLRSCFLPDLSGLHLRIYQFQRLLHQHLPQLAEHLDGMQIHAAYLSQWFLSFFAVTCPLPMLFRIYDVIFAEGASETLMRVALAIMTKNESRLLALAEFEDVIQLLLSRALWDPYGCNAQSADDLVNDFCSFTGVVTRESLQSLEAGFRESQGDDETVAKSRFLPEVQSAAQRFLGRIWGPDKRATLTPPSSDKQSRPASFMKRTTSKQSIASTLNSVEASSDSTGRSHASTATALTEMTSRSRESSADNASVKSLKMDPNRLTISAKDRDFHSQIEDLLTALSEMQREQTNLNAQLQREREERREDHRIIRSLVDRVNIDQSSDSLRPPSSKADRRLTLPVNANGATANKRLSTPLLSAPQSMDELMKVVEERFPKKAHHHRNSSVFETKQYLRDSLARTKEQLQLESSRSQSLSRQLLDSETETDRLRNELNEARRRLQDSHVDKQRLERSIQDLKQQQAKVAKSNTWPAAETAPEVPTLTRSNTTDSPNKGLRELKLGRSTSGGSTRNSMRGGPMLARVNTFSSPTSAPRSNRSSSPHGSGASYFDKRASTVSAHAVLTPTEHHPLPAEDSLLADLVSAKTSEALAKQELEELKARCDGMRKELAKAKEAQEKAAAEAAAAQAQAAASAAMSSMPGTPKELEPVKTGKSDKKPGSSHSTTSTSGGGGWFWGKRTASTAVETK
ncbi:rab-GTPase-TBC domain-containing protein [Phyllosticta capitalensis]|uniref:Rab-GTPase-TBC domain-containing protein n=1 Tax=Phyllosticta capitalensis TaxID=121624 RepID=A0ABR1YAJ1_9PEZI